MQVADGIDWTLSDFVVAGMLLIGTGSLYVLLSRKVPRYRVAIGIVLAVILFWIWAELAVGVFTTWGS